jgi:tRNA(Arg) A34 adenosine deaminase TadA
VIFVVNGFNFLNMENDKLFLLRAIELAADGISVGGGPFGALVVKNNKIISESTNRVVLNNDPTAHAEILAIRQAAESLKTFDLDGCTLYTSCEPCPMCLGAIYWSGIKKVVYSCDRCDAEKAGFSDKLIYDEIILDPSKRSVKFLHLADADGERIFKKWDETGDKIAY